MNIQTAVLPPHAEMVRAMLERDTAYEGVFFTAVQLGRQKIPVVFTAVKNTPS